VRFLLALMLYSVTLKCWLVVTFEVTSEYLKQIQKYIKKQEDWNQHQRKQLFELTGVSTVSLNDLFYVGLYVWDMLCLIIIIWILLNLVEPRCKINSTFNIAINKILPYQLCYSTKTMAAYMNILLLLLLPLVCSIPCPYMWKLPLAGFIVLQEQVETEEAKPPTNLGVQSIICYKRSLERENKAFAKRMRKLKKVNIRPFFYISCSFSVAPVGRCCPRPIILQTEALCLKI
jgi:hypothetical protein